nr:ribonuclease H-like domain-containing protein [Tanacetum cinerariifolium]
MNQFCKIKGIMRQYSVARTPQQDGIAERRNRTLIEAARTMLADFKLPTTFWAEAVNTACYVQKRVLVVKPYNKTPYELFHDRTPALSFMRLFGCTVTILNTKDYLGKFDGKADEGFFVGYSLNCKAFKVFNNRTRIVEEKLHIRFNENTPNVVGSGPDWLFDIDALTRTMHYEPIIADNGFQPSSDHGKMVDEDLRKESECKDQEKEDNVNSTNTVNAASTNGVNTVAYASFKDFMLYKMDVKSAFLYEKIEKEVYVYQPPGFKDLDFPDKVYKVEKALYGLHQAPRACYEILSTYLLDNGFYKGKIDKTLFIRRLKGLQVKQKQDGIFISQDKYVTEIQKKYGFIEVKNASTPMETQKPLLKDEDEVKNASTPMETQKPLLKDEDGEEVDIHMYRSMIGSLIYLTSSRPDIMFTYALTVNPMVFTLCIEQLWASVKAKTIIGEVQLQALVDGKKVIITESTIRRDLQLEDVEGVDCLPNAAIFKQLTLMSTTMASAFICLATNQKFNFSKYIFESMVRNLDNVNKILRVESSDYNEDLGKDASKQGRISNINADEGITLVSTHDDVEMFNADIDLHSKEVFVAKQDENVVVKEVDAAQAKAKGIVFHEPEESTTTPIATMPKPKSQDNGKAILIEEPMKLKKKDQIMLDEEDDVQEKIDADYQLAKRMQAKEQQELNDEEKATLFMQLLEKRRKFFAAKRVEEKRNKPPTQAQQRKIMSTYLKNMEGKKLKDMKNKYFDSIQKIFDRAFKRVNIFVDYKTKLVEGSSKREGTELEQESSKRQKIDDDKETTELKQLVKIISDEEGVAIDVIPLGGIVRIKRLLDDLEVIAVKVYVAAAMQNLMLFSSSKRKGTELEQESSKRQKIDDDKETTELKQLVKIISDEEGVAIDVIPLVVKPPRIMDWKNSQRGKNSYYQILMADGSS